MLKKFKCRTFAEDTITMDYGVGHMLLTTIWVDKLTGNSKQLSVCLNDKDIDNMIEFLLEVRGK